MSLHLNLGLRVSGRSILFSKVFASQTVFLFELQWDMAWKDSRVYGRKVSG
jgi:hypothetical protein